MNNYIVIFQDKKTGKVNTVYGPFSSTNEATAYAVKWIEIDEIFTVTLIVKPFRDGE